MLALLTMLFGASAQDDRREVYRQQLEARKSVKNQRRENYKKAMERKRMESVRRVDLPASRIAFSRNVARNKQRANRAAAMKL